MPKPQVYLIAPDGGEATRLTNLATGATAIKWFPDGKRIAFVSWVWPDLDGDAAQAKRLKSRKDDKVKAHDQRTRRIPLLGPLADRRSRAARLRLRRRDRTLPRRCSPGPGSRCSPGSRRPTITTSAPDGRELALTIDLDPEPAMMNRADIAVVDLKSGRWRNLTADSGMSDEHPCYSPDGRYIACHAYDTERSFNDQGHLRVIERRSGKVAVIAPAFDRATQHLQWAPDSQRAAVARRGSWARRVVAPSAVERASDAGSSPAAAISGFARSADGRRARVRRATARRIRRRCSRRTATAAASGRSSR